MNAINHDNASLISRYRCGVRTDVNWKCRLMDSQSFRMLAGYPATNTIEGFRGVGVVIEFNVIVSSRGVIDSLSHPPPHPRVICCLGESTPQRKQMLGCPGPGAQESGETRPTHTHHHHHHHHPLY